MREQSCLALRDAQKEKGPAERGLSQRWLSYGRATE
jgi:hypothetical protein